MISCTKDIMLNKLVSPGVGKYCRVFFKIQIKEGELTISGVEGPRSNGDCRGSAGQIVGTVVDHYSEGWDKVLLDGFYQIWKDWHLNGMLAGCEHQIAMGWNKLPIDPSKPINTYGRHFEGQKSDSWNMLGWVRESEHPEGRLMRACPTCGYKYGSAWKRIELPKAVIEFLEKLPETAAAFPRCWA